jgi:hypothetical protein
MKHLLIFAIVAVIGCTSQEKTEQENRNEKKEHVHSEPQLNLNNGLKWKADQATKTNVAALLQVMEEASVKEETDRLKLYNSLQVKTDILIKQCRMQGSEHDALHVWLERVLKDMKELKDDEEDYNEVFAVLKKDIESFYVYFD